MSFKIGYDAKRIFNNKTGLGNYGRALVGSLINDYKDDSFFLFTPKTSVEFHQKRERNVHVIEPPKPVKVSISSLWRSFYLSNYWKTLNLDIYHGLSHELPLIPADNKVKTIVTIHDLSYIKYPEGFPWLDRKVYDAKFSYACSKADIIVAISESTANDVERMLKVDRSKIRVIGQSANEIFYREQIEEKHQKNLNKLDLKADYLLSVGLHHKRKNIKNLVLAYNKAKHELPLVLVGEMNNYGKEIKSLVEKLNLEKKVLFRSSVSLSELHTLYSKAYFTLYPSLYEGFGLPVLESLLCQTPVLTSKGSCLEEVGKEAAIYCDPESVNSIAENIELINDDLREKLLAKRNEAIGEFDPTLIAKKMHGLYESLV